MKDLAGSAVLGHLGTSGYVMAMSPMLAHVGAGYLGQRWSYVGSMLSHVICCDVAPPSLGHVGACCSHVVAPSWPTLQGYQIYHNGLT